jgi:hypothetical protein
MALTQSELGAIRKRAEAATAGLIVNERDYYEHKTARLVTNGHVYVAKVFTGQADAEFIANARQDVPALLAEVERLSYERKQYLERYVWLLEGIGKDKALDIIRKAMAEKEDE